MDVLSDVLTRAHARQGVFARSIVDPPWALQFLDAAPLALEVLLQGHAWLTVADGDPIELRAGDVALLVGVASYVLADSPSTRPGAVVYGPGLAAAAGESRASAGDRWRRPGTRTYGSDGATNTILLRSAYQAGGGVAQRLLASLPPALRIPAGALPAAVLELMNSEIDVDAPGQQAILDRLLDLLVVVAIRSWFERPDSTPPGWYSALKDPAVGHALSLIHEAPQRSWTVAAISAEVGLSRAAFARRFTALTGQPPIGYLTAWRMDIAADLLRDTESTVDAIARKIGYADGFSLSTAFRRHHGRSPMGFRREIQ